MAPIVPYMRENWPEFLGEKVKKPEKFRKICLNEVGFVILSANLHENIPLFFVK